MTWPGLAMHTSEGLKMHRPEAKCPSNTLDAFRAGAGGEETPKRQMQQKITPKITI